MLISLLKSFSEKRLDYFVENMGYGILITKSIDYHTWLGRNPSNVISILFGFWAPLLLYQLIEGNWMGKISMNVFF